MEDIGVLERYANLACWRICSALSGGSTGGHVDGWSCLRALVSADGSAAWLRKTGAPSIFSHLSNTPIRCRTCSARVFLAWHVVCLVGASSVICWLRIDGFCASTAWEGWTGGFTGGGGECAWACCMFGALGACLSEGDTFGPTHGCCGGCRASRTWAKNVSAPLACGGRRRVRSIPQVSALE